MENYYLENLRWTYQSLENCHLLHGYLNDDRTHHLNGGNLRMKKEHLESQLIHLDHQQLHPGNLFLHRLKLEIQTELQNHYHCYAILNGRPMRGDCLVLVEQMMECSLAVMLDLVRLEKEYLLWK